MTYLVDHNLPGWIADVLRNCGVDAYALAEKFAPDSLDREWLPQAAANGWIVITADDKIRRRRDESAIFDEYGLTAIFFPQNFPGESKLARTGWFLTHLDRAEQRLGRNPHGMKVAVKSGGAVEVWNSGSKTWK